MKIHNIVLQWIMLVYTGIFVLFSAKFHLQNRRDIEGADAKLMAAHQDVIIIYSGIHIRISFFKQDIQ